MRQVPVLDPLSLLVYQGKPTVNKPQLITNPSLEVPTLGGYSLSRVMLIWFLAFSSASPPSVPMAPCPPQPPAQVSHHMPHPRTCPQHFRNSTGHQQACQSAATQVQGLRLRFGRYHVLFCFRLESSSKARPVLRGRAPHTQSLVQTGLGGH